MFDTLSAELDARYTAVGTALVSKSVDFRVEIGDTKQPDFKPQVKIVRWDNETNFSVRYVTEERGDVVSEGNQVRYRTATAEVRLGDVNGFDEDSGGFALDVLLFERPASNVLEFTLQSKGLVCAYQPPLANVEPNGDTWEPWKHGGTLHRPAAKAGSYAFFHEAQRDDYSKQGGHNYRNGKAFHLDRPWAEDADGARVWCDLFVDLAAERLTVTVPQTFLDTAAYPVLVDPTFGYTSIGGTEAGGQFFVNRLFGSKAAPASNGTVDSVTTYARVGSASNSFKGVVVLASTKAIIANGVSNAKQLNDVSAGTAHWATATMGTPPSVTAGTDYYICKVGGGTDAWGSLFLDAAPANTAIYHSSNNFTTPIDPTSGAGASDEPERTSDYATYTESAPETITLDKWHQPASVPTRRRRGMVATGTIGVRP